MSRVDDPACGAVFRHGGPGNPAATCVRSKGHDGEHGAAFPANPWAHIDELKRRLVEEKARAVARLVAAGFKGAVEDRLKFDGQSWVFVVSGRKYSSRTLGGLLELIPGTSVKQFAEDAVKP